MSFQLPNWYLPGLHGPTWAYRAPTGRAATWAYRAGRPTQGAPGWLHHSACYMLYEEETLIFNSTHTDNSPGSSLLKYAYSEASQHVVCEAATNKHMVGRVLEDVSSVI